MSYRVTQAFTGAATPKAAQAAGDSGGFLAEPLGEERLKWVEEQERLRRQQEQGSYKKGGSVKGWGKARGARKAKVY